MRHISTTDFPPSWLLMTMDALTVAACFFIPFTLFMLMRNRLNTPHAWIAGMLALVSFLFGLEHLAGILQLPPGIRLVIGTLVALAMLAAAATIVRVAPRVLRTLDSLRERSNAAEASSSAKDSFLANMSHEIRTPLNSMIGLAELVLESGLTPQQRTHIHTILNSSETLLEIINDILDLSKINSGKLTLEPLPFNLRSAMEDLMDLFAPSIRRKGKPVELILDYRGNAPESIIADAVRIKQVMCNLISNAIKFTERGYIAITVECIGEKLGVGGVTYTLKCSVTDTGMGIPRDKQRLIFDKFTQADASTTRKFGGTGLGLAICRQLAEMMHGEVGLESESGVGSTFWFTLTTHSPESTLAQRAKREKLSLKGMRALIISNIPPEAEALCHQLHEWEADSDIMENLENIATITEKLLNRPRPHDLLFLTTDVNTPLNRKLIETVREHSACTGVGIYVLGPEITEERAAEIAALGCQGWLAKPYKHAALREALEIHVQSLTKGVMPCFRYYHHPSLHQRAQIQPPLHNRARFADVDILVVEDNRVNMEYAREVLEKMGCTVHTACNGKEAVERVLRQEFDLILMDCQMPEMDGFEASRIITGYKEEGRIRNTPILALTANAMQGDRERCLASGMNGYLSKPVRKADFEAALTQWVPAPSPLQAVNG